MIVINLVGELEWGSFDSIKQAFDVNVFGLVRVARAFLPLIRQSQGRYVIVSSLAGRVVAPGNLII